MSLICNLSSLFPIALWNKYECKDTGLNFKKFSKGCIFVFHFSKAVVCKLMLMRASWYCSMKPYIWLEQWKKTMCCFNSLFVIGFIYFRETQVDDQINPIKMYIDNNDRHWIFSKMNRLNSLSENRNWLNSSQSLCCLSASASWVKL